MLNMRMKSQQLQVPTQTSVNELLEQKMVCSLLSTMSYKQVYMWGWRYSYSNVS